MTNPNENPHQEYLRQTSEHYGLTPPPRISRGGPSGPAAPKPPVERPWAESVQPEQPEQPWGQSANWSSSGISDAGPVTPQPGGRVVPPPPPQWAHTPPPQQAAHPAPPPPPTHVRYPTAGPVLPGSPPGPGQGLDLQPSHAMWVLAGLSALCTFFSGFGWILVAGACAYAAWFFTQRHTRWPADIEDLLVRIRLTQATPGPVGAPPVAYIPFRSMTFPELFGGAFKVVTKNWPTLVGIPLVLLLAAGVVFGVAGLVVFQIMMSTGETLFNTMGFGFLFVVYGIFTLLVSAVALPLDALLIALGVIATDKAVRGERIRLTSVFSLAQHRIFPVVRLTLAFYGIFLLADLLLYGVFFAAIMSASFALGIVLYCVLFAANFAVGIMFSLAPIVVVTERRGVADSFRRSMQLVKSSWGRVLAIHLLWAICAVPLIMLPSFVLPFLLGPVGMVLFFVVAFAILIAYVRTLQLLVYTDLRIRQEHYEHELIADWARNTGVR